jgi:uncharacterized membrane protein
MWHMMAAMTATRQWAVTLYPHRSLTREGFVAIMVLLVLINLVGGMVFLLAGAWPITGFMGLDVLLVWWAFRKNFRDARRSERIVIDADSVTLERYGNDGARQRQSFNRRWLRVELEQDEARDLVGRLLLVSHGVRTEIASFLGADERLSLAKALRRALA